MPEESLVGKTLGPYRILRLIGEGGVAWVFLAVHEQLGRQVALKVLFPSLAQDREFVSRFAREARISGQLQHPNIVRIYDVGEQDGYYYIAMEYIDGESLRNRLRRRKRLDIRETIAILGQIARALDYAHQHGVVHRDIKPSNILIDEKGTVYLTDFGIARATWETRVTRTGIRVGTPEYMSPEQAQGKEPDFRSDLYSLGVILYEMLCGYPPFRGHDPLSVLHKIVYEPVSLPRPAVQGVTPAVESVILRALDKRVTARFQSGAEMLRALQATASGKSPVRSSVGKPLPRRGGASASPGAVAAAISGFVVVALLAIFLLSREGATGPDRAESFDRQSALTSPTATAPRPPATAGMVITPTSTPMPTMEPTSTPLPPTPTPPPTPVPTPRPTDTKVPPPPLAQGKIAYAIWLEDWHYQVWIMNLDGSDKRMLVDYASEPCFSPDGKQVVYYHWETAGNGGFFIINADGTGNRKIRTEPASAFPAWSPDGGTIAYQGGDFVNWRFNIYAIHTDGSGHRLIVDGEQPAWSPDGRIVYKGCLGNECGLMIVNADGSGKHRITLDPNDMNPSWSPDGRKIAFAGNRSGNWEIYTVNPDGRDLKQLTDHERTDALPAWTPDSRQIVFRSDRDGSWGIWIVNADGSGLRKLTEARASDRWRWEKLSVGK